jgi:hypothetical protein
MAMTSTINGARAKASSKQLFNLLGLRLYDLRACLARIDGIDRRFHAERMTDDIGKLASHMLGLYGAQEWMSPETRQRLEAIEAASFPTTADQMEASTA